MLHIHCRTTGCRCNGSFPNKSYISLSSFQSWCSASLLGNVGLHYSTPQSVELLEVLKGDIRIASILNITVPVSMSSMGGTKGDLLSSS